mgnify:CR=1 FL=1
MICDIIYKNFEGIIMDKYLNIINKFINKMNYKNNSRFLGVYFYGSCLTGFNGDDSDIDLHIIFDDSDSKHIFRGVSYIDGVKIEYFEKCISDVYLSVKNDIKDRCASTIERLFKDINSKNYEPQIQLIQETLIEEKAYYALLPIWLLNFNYLSIFEILR